LGKKVVPLPKSIIKKQKSIRLGQKRKNRETVPGGQAKTTATLGKNGGKVRFEQKG